MNQEYQKETTEQIWRELSSRLRQFVQSRIDSSADVDDVLQMVFLRIHAKLDELHSASKLESWVFQITRNAVTDFFRSRRAVQTDVESLAADADDTTADDLRAELSRCLVALIEKLPKDQRRAISMYELEGLSQKDIAIRESISVSGAKSRIQRGRKSLERILKACCEFQLDRRGNVLDYEATNEDCCDEDCG